MRKLMRNLILSCLMFLSPKVFSEVSAKNVLTFASLSGGAGFLLGLSYKKNQIAHGMLFSSLAFSSVALLGLLKMESKEKKELDELMKNKDLFPPHTAYLKDYGDSYFLEKDLPKNLEEIVIKGSWSLYKLEKSIGSYFWQEIEKNTFVKDDEIFKFKPPKINPKLQKLNKEVFDE